MSKKQSGKRKPFKYPLSMHCSLINKTVQVTIQELRDGYPIGTLWKKVEECNCNSICNPDNPSNFPLQCPAKKIEKSNKS